MLQSQSLHCVVRTVRLMVQTSCVATTFGVRGVKCEARNDASICVVKYVPQYRPYNISLFTNYLLPLFV